MTKQLSLWLLLFFCVQTSWPALGQVKQPKKAPATTRTGTSKTSTTVPAKTATPQDPSTFQKGVTQVQGVLNTMYEPQTTSTFHPGNRAVNVGIGLLGANHGYDVFGSINQSPALSITYEQGLTDSFGPGTLSVGGLLGYKHYYYNFPKTTYKASWTDVLLMARVAYHYNLTSNPQIDTYAGLTIGGRLNSYSNNNSALRDDYKDEGLHLATGIFLGGRYFLTDHLGIFAEAGYDMTYLKLGLTGKF